MAMPRGAAVIPYDGKRGRVWRIKYVDAAGKQVIEAVGAERDGVTRRKAEAELRERQVKVERRGWRKPAPLTFAAYARTWFDEGKKLRQWKPQTITAYRRASKFQGDDEFVFCHPKRGGKLEQEWYAGEFRKALAAAGITDYVRPFHDARHASLTNGAAAGERPLELMARAGHRSMATTNQYVHLAGVTFPDAALALEDRLLGGRTFYPSEPTSADPATPEPAEQAATTASPPH
jgi:site-specific recombinase XerD